MTDIDDRLRAATRACTDFVPWHAPTTPAESFAALAAACEDLGIDEWDGYGERGPVARVEQEVAELLGTEAAVFFVSGTMAQQATLRVWCERRGSRRVGIPDLSHLLHHEADGPRRVHGLEFEWLTQGRRTPTAEDLRALGGGLGAALVELPLRDAGCLVPSWEDLAALSAAARELGVPLHVDGARLWEVQPFYDRPLPEIVALADSVYVSFYKGLGGLSGAAVVGDRDVMDELRRWRQRMGGQVYRMTPYAVSALVGLRDRLPRMGEYATWARAFAAELTQRGLTVHPEVPPTNTFEIYAHAPLDEVQERLVAFLERERVQPCGGWRATDVPGVVTTEFATYDAALRHDPAQVAGWVAEIAGAGGS